MDLTKDELVDYLREMYDGLPEWDNVAELVEIMNGRDDDVNFNVTAADVRKGLDVLVGEGMLEGVIAGTDPHDWLYRCRPDYLAMRDAVSDASLSAYIAEFKK